MSRSHSGAAAAELTPAGLADDRSFVRTARGSPLQISRDNGLRVEVERDLQRRVEVWTGGGGGGTGRRRGRGRENRDDTKSQDGFKAGLLYLTALRQRVEHAHCSKRTPAA